MKTHITRHILLLLAGASLTFAASKSRPINDGSGNTLVLTGALAESPNATPTSTPTSRPSSAPTNTPADTPDATLNRGDQRFFDKVAKLNDREVALSRQAAERATNPQVRTFAEEMVREHTQAGKELASLATRKGARLAPTAMKDVTETEKDWADKKGADYDKAYLKAMIDAHEDTVDVLENGADSKDPEVAAAAQKLLPKVKTHLEHAKQLHKSLD